METTKIQKAIERAVRELGRCTYEQVIPYLREMYPKDVSAESKARADAAYKAQIRVVMKDMEVRSDVNQSKVISKPIQLLLLDIQRETGVTPRIIFGVPTRFCTNCDKPAYDSEKPCTKGKEHSFSKTLVDVITRFDLMIKTDLEAVDKKLAGNIKAAIQAKNNFNIAQQFVLPYLDTPETTVAQALRARRESLGDNMQQENRPSA